MSKETTSQVQMDSELKEQVESLCQQLGISFAEAIRMFARQSVEEQAIPFTMRLSTSSSKRTLDLANGKHTIPDNINESDDETAEMFGVECRSLEDDKQQHDSTEVHGHDRHM